MEKVPDKFCYVQSSPGPADHECVEESATLGGFGAMSAIMILITITLNLKPAAFVFTGIRCWLSCAGTSLPFLIELFTQVVQLRAVRLHVSVGMTLHLLLPPGDQGENPPGDQGENPPGDQGENPPGDQGENPPGDLREFKNITLCVKPLSDDKTLERQDPVESK
ncbi:hypothetical protein J4Q44_G00085100 [Coregonus suidteri]|uniref:Uncharacterized protein n=1 Tax=Coregonus suidteri TaxID=861788 RepID=A0AAN8M3Z0_9TELE